MFSGKANTNKILIPGKENIVDMFLRKNGIVQFTRLNARDVFPMRDRVAGGG
jgi:hypothetical protein